MKRAWSVFLAALVSLLTPAAHADLGDCPELGAALVDHTCFHTTYGPFESVQATAGSTIASDTPQIDAVHTEFRIGLAGGLSVVTYQPARSGAWTVFLGSPEPLQVLDGSGAVLAETFAADGDVGCSALALAHVYELVAKETYRLLFGPTNSSHVVVVIEYVEDFLIDNGRDADGDGYGAPDDVVRSACVPPSGYVQNTGDCDDDNPRLNPGVQEICDGVDQNCNGLPDDVGLECRVGQGECTRAGTVTCDGLAGDLAGCGAQAAAPEHEFCDGKDNDCDGVIDQEDDLCREEPGGPTCVRQDLGAFCGCALDQDCGPPDSARVCDLTQNRCIDGCSNDPGRNGCPEGERCQEAAPGSGQCVLDDGSGGDSGDGLAGGPGEEPTIPPTAGCGCRIGEAPHPGGTSTALLLLAGLVLVRRRSRRASRCPLRAAHLAAVMAAPWIVACGGQVDGLDASGGSQNDGCVPVLGDKTVVHACSHTDRGSDISVGATVSEPPDVSKLHKTFSVLVAEEAGTLTYAATRSGQHVVLTNRAVALDVLDGAAPNSPPLQGRAFPVEGCTTIAWAQRVDLDPERTYTLRTNEAVGSKFQLFIEYPPAFGERAWETTCP